MWVEVFGDYGLTSAGFSGDCGSGFLLVFSLTPRATLLLRVAGVMTLSRGGFFRPRVSAGISRPRVDKYGVRV